VCQLERGEASALEVIDTLFAEELTLRENRRIKDGAADGQVLDYQDARMIRLLVPAVLDRKRILALAQLDFVDRHEVIHFLGPPGTGKSHLATALAPQSLGIVDQTGALIFRENLGRGLMPSALKTSRFSPETRRGFSVLLSR
jgi:hypothetical protein